MSRLLLCIVLVVTFHSRNAMGQDSRLALEVGVGLGFNQGRTADFADTSGNIVAGAGYNFSRVASAMLEYQYYNFGARSAFVEENLQRSFARLESVTANLIVRPHKWGIYGIGGGGWYKRSLDLRVPNPVQGFTSDSAMGINLGSGVELPISGRLKMFGEFRYHHVYNSQVPTDVLPITFGFRW